MKKFICVIVICMLCCTIMAQRTQKLQVVNSQEIIQKGMQFHDDGKYQDAINEYSRVPFGDVNYDLALYEKAISQEAFGDYRGAIQNINLLLELPSCQVGKNLLYSALGDCYDYLEQYDKAIEAYNKGLEVSPYDYLLHFNKGVSQMNQELYESAMESFKHAIFISPIHQSSHYRYGLCCLQLGYTVPGILALNFATIIYPYSKYCIAALQLLEEVYNEGVTAFNNDNDVTIYNPYDELNEFYKPIHNLLDSKAAESKKFKSLTNINHKVLKYNQLVFSNVSARPNSNAVEDLLYAPYFQQIINDNWYNTFCYLQLSSTNINNNKVANKALKMQKEFDDFISFSIPFIHEKASLGFFTDNDENLTYVYSKQLQLEGWGKYNDKLKNLKVKEGTWTILNQQGQIDEIANYKLGKREGSIKLYQDRQLVQLSTWKNDEPEGQVKLYKANPFFHQSIPSEEFILKNGKYEGPYKAYHSNGALSTEGSLVHSKFDGTVHYYDAQGHLTGIENYQNQEQYGPATSYYPGGQLKISTSVGAKDEETTYTEYYIDGTKKYDGFVTNNNYSGKWTCYYPSGAIMSIKNYNKEGEEDGELYNYDRNGKVTFYRRMEQGKIAEEKSYDEISGLLDHSYEFSDGKLVKVKNYNPDGSIRADFPVKNKTVTFDLYSVYGYKEFDGTLDENFNWQGSRKNYYPNGQVKEETNWQDNDMQGDGKQYYANGRLSYHATYQKGHVNGLRVSYFDNSKNQVSQERYVINDTVVGTGYDYYPDGTTKAMQWNDKNGNTLYQCYYRPDNTKSEECYYLDGALCIVKYYNRNNEIIAQDTLVNGNGTLHEYYPEGQVIRAIPVKGGKSLGMEYTYNLAGKVIDSTYYLMGDPNDMIREYYPTGETKSIGRYIEGYPHGQHSEYLVDGTKSMDEYYEFGDLISSTSYALNNTPLRVNTYFDDNMRTLQWFAPDGKTALMKLYYADNTLFKISCAQKGGKMADYENVGTGEHTFKAYYPNGALGGVISYKNGVLNGVRSIYYPNGQAYETATFSEGNFEGPVTTYYQNGSTHSKKEYKDDYRHGKYILYYPDGKIKYEGHYHYDLEHGEFNTYDKDGKLTHRVVMYYGEPIEDERF
jgi:antitoxin component YwqK of YwqJK toxin-antitoxin module/tetratricopeptide (TPR) repeat protein